MKLIWRVIGWSVFGLATLVWVLPLLLGLSLSFRSNSSVNLAPLGVPHLGYWANYSDAWTTGDAGTSLLTSGFVVVLSWIWLVLAGGAGSYYIGRRGGRVSAICYGLILGGAMVPAVARLFPLYSLMAEMGLTGNPVSVVIFQAGALTPITVLLFRSFLKRVPRDYEEAASLDGAGTWQTLWHVVLPQLRPAIGAVMAITGVFIWNDFFTPLLLLSGSHYQTMPVKMFSFVGQYTAQWGDIFAFLVIGAMPVVVFFLFLQKYLIAGLSGGVTG